MNSFLSYIFSNFLYNPRKTFSRLKETTVFVLGAGASKQAQYPVYSDLLSLDYINSLEKELSQFTTSVDYSYLLSSMREDCAYFANYKTHFEELLYILENQNKKDFDRAITYYHRIMLMAWNLMGETVDRVSRYEYLFAFAEFLLAINGRNPSVVLSFNHDDVIETAVHGVGESELYRGKKGLGYTYDLPKKSTAALDSFSPQANDFSRKVILYKLHGSVNWLVCPKCHSIFVGGEDMLITIYGFNDSHSLCRICNDSKLESTLIAPKRIKDYSSMKYQWEKASQRLRQAGRIIFVGYSMPAYDVEAFNLFKDSISETTEILVVNPNLTPELRERFRSLPGSRHMGTEISLGEFMSYVYYWGKPPDGVPL